MIELVRRRLFGIQPQCPLLRLSHLLPFAGGQKREGHAVHLLLQLPARQIHTAQDVRPLVVTAKLHFAFQIAGHDHKIVGLHQHVVELQERKPLLQPLLKALRPQHVVDRKVAADIPDKFYVVQGQQPGGVVDADGLSSLWLFIGPAAAVGKCFVELDEFLEQLLKLVAVVLDGLWRHHLPHIGAAGRVAHHGRAPADEDNGRMAVLLHPHHYDYLHKMPYVQAVRCRVKADVKADAFLSQKLADFFVVRGLFDKAPFLQHVVYIGMFAYMIADKHDFSSFCSILSRKAGLRRRPGQV